MSTNPQPRPRLAASLSGTEFLRWYWLKDELLNFARTLGIPTAGSKPALTERIAAHLEGHPAIEAPASRPRSSHQLKGPLSVETVILEGQRCSQILRAWFIEQTGPSFHFDAAMRDYFASATGTTTLGDALTHWHNTRGETMKSIDPQFEYNRFTRRWHSDNPNGTRTELIAAWKTYRSLPTDQRDRA